MGHFLAVSAFKTQDVDQLCQAVIEYCGRFGVDCSMVDEGAGFVDQTDAIVHVPDNGWARIFWPNYFSATDFPLCRSLSCEQQLVISTVHVYDGDFWEHLFLDRGEVLHKFCSWPDYFGPSPEEAEKAKSEWKGDPEALAEFVGIPVERISGYMVHMSFPPSPKPQKRSFFSLFRRRSEPPPEPVQPIKAYEDDEFHLEDFWVFTDFWRKLGIRYPDSPDAYVARRLRLDGRFLAKLPSD